MAALEAELQGLRVTLERMEATGVTNSHIIEWMASRLQEIQTTLLEDRVMAKESHAEVLRTFRGLSLKMGGMHDVVVKLAKEVGELKTQQHVPPIPTPTPAMAPPPTSTTVSREQLQATIACFTSRGSVPSSAPPSAVGVAPPTSPTLAAPPTLPQQQPPLHPTTSPTASSPPSPSSSEMGHDTSVLSPPPTAPLPITPQDTTTVTTVSQQPTRAQGFFGRDGMPLAQRPLYVPYVLEQPPMGAPAPAPSDETRARTKGLSMAKMVLLGCISLLAALTFNSLLELNAAKGSISMAQRHTHGSSSTQVSGPLHTQRHTSLHRTA